jgi:hypothetical protein
MSGRRVAGGRRARREGQSGSFIRKTARWPQQAPACRAVSVPGTNKVIFQELWTHEARLSILTVRIWVEFYSYLLRQTVRPVKRFKNLLQDSQLGEFYAVHTAAKFNQRISIWRRGMHRKMRVDGGSHGKAPEKDERVLLINRLR